MLYLFLAGLFEALWPLSFKLSQTTASKDLWLTAALLAMVLSVSFFYQAQRFVPVIVAYPIWTGIGALGTFMAGVFYFHDSASWLSWLGLCLIVAGISLLDYNR